MIFSRLFFKPCSATSVSCPGASFQLVLGGANYFLFFNATGLLKNWKKQHFICSNLTLFIVPFFLSFFFFIFFLSFFFFFFLRGRRPPAPSNDAPGHVLKCQARTSCICMYYAVYLLGSIGCHHRNIINSTLHVFCNSYLHVLFFFCYHYWSMRHIHYI